MRKPSLTIFVSTHHLQHYPLACNIPHYLCWGNIISLIKRGISGTANLAQPNTSLRQCRHTQLLQLSLPLPSLLSSPFIANGHILFAPKKIMGIVKDVINFIPWGILKFTARHEILSPLSCSHWNAAARGRKLPCEMYSAPALFIHKATNPFFDCAVTSENGDVSASSLRLTNRHYNNNAKEWPSRTEQRFHALSSEEPHNCTVKKDSLNPCTFYRLDNMTILLHNKCT